jgi:hypothetical protein
MSYRVRTCINLEERHREELSRVCLQTNLGRSELLRRILDYSLQVCHVNQLVPAMSGQIQLGR